MANTLSVFFTFTTATCKEDKNISPDVILNITLPGNSVFIAIYTKVILNLFVKSDEISIHCRKSTPDLFISTGTVSLQKLSATNQVGMHRNFIFFFLVLGRNGFGGPKSMTETDV